MDCKRELSATLSKKYADYLFQFQINTHHSQKIKMIPTVLPCTFKFLNYMSINQNHDIQHK